MTRINKILLPFALLLGACDSEDAVDEAAIDAAANNEQVSQSPAADGHRRGKMARLDLDKDGAISLAEAQGSPLEGKFAGLDADKDGKLTRDEMRAGKGMKGKFGKHGKDMRGEGKHGDGKGWHAKDPAERAAKILARRDADNSGTLSLAELQGSRLADRFTAVDADKNGSLSKDELMTLKGRGGKHGKFGHGDKHGKGMHAKDPAERAAKMFSRRDADNSGTLSPAEVAGSRLADKFAEVDTDRSGSLSKDELVAFKSSLKGREDKSNHRRGTARG